MPKWRVGLGDRRMIYQQVGEEPSTANDVFLGIMDTRELAARVVEAVNAQGRYDLLLEFATRKMLPVIAQCCGPVMHEQIKKELAALDAETKEPERG